MSDGPRRSHHGARVRAGLVARAYPLVAADPDLDVESRAFERVLGVSHGRVASLFGRGGGFARAIALEHIRVWTAEVVEVGRSAGGAGTAVVLRLVARVLVEGPTLVTPDQHAALLRYSLVQGVLVVDPVREALELALANHGVTPPQMDRLATFWTGGLLVWSRLRRPEREAFIREMHLVAIAVVV